MISLLVVGGGPSGLEAALIAARRGFEVMLAESATEFGGRVSFESQLPGLASWGRVTDYRMNALKQMPNVQLFPANRLQADDVLEIGAKHVAIATGSQWTRHLYSSLELPVNELAGPEVYTPDDLAAGSWPQSGPVLVFDFDNYYLGGVCAEALSSRGLAVHYATPAGHASAWTIMTNEQPYVHQALASNGIGVSTMTLLDSFDGTQAVLSDLFSSVTRSIEASAVVIVGIRLPKDDLYHELLERETERVEAGIQTLQRIGDARAPGAIAHAVYAGHEYARELGESEQALYIRDLPITEQAPGPASVN